MILRPTLNCRPTHLNTTRGVPIMQKPQYSNCVRHNTPLNVEINYCVQSKIRRCACINYLIYYTLFCIYIPK